MSIHHAQEALRQCEAEQDQPLADPTSLGVGLAAVSVDTPERSRALTEKLGLPFAPLCDPAREIVQASGIFNDRSPLV